MGEEDRVVDAEGHEEEEREDRHLRIDRGLPEEQPAEHRPESDRGRRRGDVDHEQGERDERCAQHPEEDDEADREHERGDGFKVPGIAVAGVEFRGGGPSHLGVRTVDAVHIGAQLFDEGEPSGLSGAYSPVTMIFAVDCPSIVVSSTGTARTTPSIPLTESTTSSA